MTWFNFAVWLAVLYLLYYGILVLWDTLHAGRKQVTEDAQSLTFVEDFLPEKVEAAKESAVTAAQPDAIIASGGVLIKEIFKLAQEEAIEYIRPVSF